MNKTKHKRCKTNKCYNGQMSCKLNAILDGENLKHECPCYTCLVSMICTELCYDYTSYVDSLLTNGTYYTISDDKKFTKEGTATNEFLQVITRRSQLYRPFKKATIVLGAIELNNTLYLMHNKIGIKSPMINKKYNLLSILEDHDRMLRIGPMLSEGIKFCYMVFYMVIKEQEEQNMIQYIKSVYY